MPCSCRVCSPKFATWYCIHGGVHKTARIAAVRESSVLRGQVPPQHAQTGACRGDGSRANPTRPKKAEAMCLGFALRDLSGKFPNQATAPKLSPRIRLL